MSELIHRPNGMFHRRASPKTLTKRLPASRVKPSLPHRGLMLRKLCPEFHAFAMNFFAYDSDPQTERCQGDKRGALGDWAEITPPRSSFKATPLSCRRRDSLMR